MADFVFGDFSEQETEKLFDHDKQGVKFPWSTDDCMNTPIEFGFDIPPVISPPGGTGVSYSCNGSLSHQESTNSALTSPPYSSKSSSVENVKINKQSSSSHTRHHSDRKLKKKRPPNYYTEEYQQMLEPSTLQQQQQQQQQQNQNDINEQTPTIEQNSNDERYNACDQWVDSTIKHQHDDKQSTNDEDEIESDSPETTTDTDNDNDHPQTISISKPLVNNNNESSIYSTSVASGASIETLKPSSDNLSSSMKSKPSSWADLFRSNQAAATSTTTTTTTSTSTTTNNIPQSQAQQSSPIQKAPTTTSPQQNGRNNTANNFHPKTNYHVYNSNGEESRSLEDYFSKCEVRPSAMAIKPRGLLNKSNYCYVNATLQSLLACPAFFNVMKYIPLSEDTDNHNVPCIRALHSFVNQFEKMDRSKSNTNHKDIICGASFEPTDVLQELSRLRHTPIELIKSKQEDAHELLCQLLSEIHDEICQILYNSSSNKNEESTSSSDLSTLTADLQLNGDEKSEDWLQVGKRNRTHVLRTNEIRKSLITDIFAGKFRSMVHSSGNQKSVVHEPFFTLSLDIKDPKIITLDDALIRFCEQSTVSDYVDNKNRQNMNTHKTMLIEQLPPILIVHLKCFLYDETDGIKKVNKSVNYTVNLTLPKNILTDAARKHSNDRYKLFAVEYHQGDHATKGHYITDVFHPGLQGWLRFDDGNVHVVTSNQVINPTADKLTPYLLFYRRD